MKAVINAGRDSIAKLLVGVGRRLSTDIGWAKLSHDHGAPNMLAGLLGLRQRGAKPLSVVDGGACMGDWTRLCLSVFPDARILMVEPQPQHEAELLEVCRRRPQQLLYARALLGPPHVDRANFFVLDDTSGGTGSSVLPELSQVNRHAVEMPITTLDTLIRSTGMPCPDLIKLDVQGYELEVLKGAGETLERAAHVLLEVSIRQYNEGSPLLHEVTAWMAQQGFRVTEIFDLTRSRSDELLQVDLLFGR